MEKAVQYTCSCCGQVHEGWPVLSYDYPIFYSMLSEEDKNNIAQVTDDYCIINHPNRTDWFIRCTLRQKVTGHCNVLEYSLWVSLSEKSFKDYIQHFGNNVEAEYFGWLCNYPPEYNFDIDVAMKAITKPNGIRPEIFPDPTLAHPFVRDYSTGITKTDAERRIADMLNSYGKKSPDKKKQWWKFWQASQ